MSVQTDSFPAFLVRGGLISAGQLAEAMSLSRKTDVPFLAALIKLDHVSFETAARALAEYHGRPFVSLKGVTVPREVVELIPESVARENLVFPLGGAKGGALIIAICDPTDFDMIKKLRFILNREIVALVAVAEDVIDAINRHYGLTETESVDSMLAEFYDTAIDFTEIATPKKQSLDRRATVRYYHRMNPERLFPLLVILSEQEIQAVVKTGVLQKSSQAFRVEEGAVVEVEPILPGCDCYPRSQKLTVQAGPVQTTFWVTPRVLGRLRDARVVVRQGDAVLAEVPLEAAVAKQGLTLLLGGLSLVLPFVLTVLKHFHLDFESQAQEGFSLYAVAAGWAMRSLSPELLAGVLVAATAGAWFWLRPRRRDVFWDVKEIKPNK